MNCVLEQDVPDINVGNIIIGILQIGMPMNFKLPM